MDFYSTLFIITKKSEIKRMFLNDGIDKEKAYNGTLFSNKRKKLFMQTIT